MFSGFLARAFTTADRQSRLFGDRQQVEHSGLKTVSRETYCNWQIEVSHRQVGLTVRRDQYSAVMSPDGVGREKYLSGFTSCESALVAARAHIDALAEPVSTRWHPAHKRVGKGRFTP